MDNFETVVNRIEISAHMARAEILRTQGKFKEERKELSSAEALSVHEGYSSGLDNNTNQPWFLQEWPELYEFWNHGFSGANIQQEY